MMYFNELKILVDW